MKFVFSAAILGALAQDLFAALEPVAQKHFGTTAGEIMTGLAEAAPAILQATAPNQPASQPGLTITSKGAATQGDATLSEVGDLGLALTDAELQAAAKSEQTNPGVVHGAA